MMIFCPLKMTRWEDLPWSLSGRFITQLLTVKLKHNVTYQRISRHSTDIRPLHCCVLILLFYFQHLSTMGGIVRFEKKICPSHFWPFLDVTCDICRDMKDMMDMMTHERTWWPMWWPHDHYKVLYSVEHIYTLLNKFVQCWTHFYGVVHICTHLYSVVHFCTGFWSIL